MTIQEIINKYHIEDGAKYGKPNSLYVSSMKSLKPSEIEEIRKHKDEILTELARQAEEQARHQAEERKAQEDRIKSGEEKIKLIYHDGEYLSGWEAIGIVAELLSEIGLAKWVDGWGYHVSDTVVEKLSEEFTYQEALEYAKPQMEAKQAALEEKQRKQVVLEEEKKSMVVEILQRGVSQGEESDPYAVVKITDPKTKEQNEFICRNIFDFGYTINPAYSIADGLKPGGLPIKDKNGKWCWQNLVSDKGWCIIRPMTAFEIKAIEYLQKFPPISKEVRM